MAEGLENRSNVASWFKITWPVIAFTIGLALAGLGAFSKVKIDMAVIKADNAHLKTDLGEMKSDIKEIKAILMNPVR